MAHPLTFWCELAICGKMEFDRIEDVIKTLQNQGK